eukprot:gnl/MRDRNA2_/MRDRNA2_110349_c0_seq1.p1 gnl/MRDRNA2_/MRDRNA2_110349_c0~~gnl/MRDRNA2_/MRDRNA2_110349_c0_seq1.p1  ORF type:complete len:142 (+),score=7.33 gnl/MRDRNA2_/MRDRNA2_110349_c0_seq1:87-512(+)
MARDFHASIRNVFVRILLLGLWPQVQATVDCQDPPYSQPDYCCDNGAPSAMFQDTCECNADWSSEECTCRGHTLQGSCRHCHEVHGYGDLCRDCVDSCIDEYEDGMCAAYVDDWMEEQYGSSGPKGVLCGAALLSTKRRQH